MFNIFSVYINFVIRSIRYNNSFTSNLIYFYKYSHNIKLDMFLLCQKQVRSTSVCGFKRTSVFQSKTSHLVWRNQIIICELQIRIVLYDVKGQNCRPHGSQSHVEKRKPKLKQDWLRNLRYVIWNLTRDTHSKDKLLPHAEKTNTCLHVLATDTVHG